MTSKAGSRAIAGALAVILSTAAAGGESVWSTGAAAAVQRSEPEEREADLHDGQLPNNFPFVNAAGTAATFSTTGSVELENEFHTPQGTNGRSCATCHLVQAGWSVRPIDVEVMFWTTQGRHPIFNKIDANNPSPNESTIHARYASYSMLRKGLFRRGGDLSASADFEIVAVDDPLGAGGSPTRFEAFRRPLATANFHIAKNVGWHDQNTNGSGDVHAGLVGQARGNITGAQQGDPPAAETLEAIAVYEEGLAFAQQSLWSIGRLDGCGARGGAESLSAQGSVRGRFDLYDAWIGLRPGACSTRAKDKKRAQIARGQELFNNPNPGGRCGGCHNAANNGSHVTGALFDVGASRAEFRKPGMPLYTLRQKSAPFLERKTTDPGRALRTGRWADLDLFKTPSLRGISARAPYFHNGIAETLHDVVRHYERALGFVFTPEEEDDLVAFLEAL
jgi:hypothetical protein